MKIRNIKDDAWYEVFRLCILIIVAFLLIANWNYTRDLPALGRGNRAMLCTTLGNTIRSAPIDANNIEARRVYQENCK